MIPPVEPPIVRRRIPVESAAVAGMIYSVVAVVALVLVRRVPATPTDPAWRTWIGDASNRRSLVLALGLSSVAAVAFLWFVAVVRRRVGDREDRFFATVFLGSALVHVGIWLTAVASLSALALGYSAEGRPPSAETAGFARGLASGLLLVAGPRVQAVFITSTATIFLRTKVVPRWLAYVGFAAAAVMFVAPFVATPLGVGLPSFVFVSSVVIFFVAETRPGRPA